jgi:ABC-type ATPase involved in cell division
MVLRSVFALYQQVPNILSRVAVMMKPQVVFVLGGPGAGKGTQCTKITEVGRLARVHVNSGEIDCSDRFMLLLSDEKVEVRMFNWFNLLSNNALPVVLC